MSTSDQDRRRQKRTKMVLGVRLFLGDQRRGSEFQLAHTIDITQAGAKLGGLRASFQPGEVLVLQRGQKKAHFRVIWTRELSQKEIHIGIEAVEADRSVWGLDLTEDDGAPEYGPDLRLLFRKKKSARAGGDS